VFTLSHTDLPTEMKGAEFETKIDGDGLEEISQAQASSFIN
jgi:hypothetical protein